MKITSGMPVALSMVLFTLLQPAMADSNEPVIVGLNSDPLILKAELCEVSRSINDESIAAWLASARAFDAEDGELSVENNAPEAFLIGDTVVTFRATDSIGLVATIDSTLSLNGVPNSNPTIIDVPAAMTVTALPGATSVANSNEAVAAFLSTAVGLDAEDGDLVVSNDAPEIFQLGETVITFTVTDSCGVLTSVESTITIESDSTIKSFNQPPVLNSQDPITLRSLFCKEPIPVSDPAIVSFLEGAVALDLEDGNLSLQIINDAPDEFAVGEDTIVTFTVTDSGEPTGISYTKTMTSTITVAHVNTPILKVPDSFIIAVTDESEVVLKSNENITAFLALATAEVQEIGHVEVINDAPEFFAPGLTRVTFKVLGACGNVVTATSDVIVGILP